MNTYTNALVQVARKEIIQHIRTKRLLLMGGGLLVSLFLITLVVAPKLFGGIETGTPTQHLVLLGYFSALFVGGYFFIQLLAIVLTADAVCSEWNNRTIFLLLSKPVPRTAFVLGKYLGSTATVAVTVALSLGVDYVLMIMRLPGTPSGGDIVGFLAAVGVLILGAAAFGAISLLFSTLTKSTVLSLLSTLAMWMIVFPLLGQMALFVAVANGTIDVDGAALDWSRYLSPGACMTVAGTLLVPDEASRQAFDFFSNAPDNVGLAVLALVGHIVVYVGASLWIVSRRNFE